MDIDYRAWDFWWNVFITVSLFAFAVYQWIRNRHWANAKDIEKLDRRVVFLENEIRHLPNQAQIRALEAQLASVSKDLSEVTGELHAIVRQLGLINKHLLQKGS